MYFLPIHISQNKNTPLVPISVSLDNSYIGTSVVKAVDLNKESSWANYAIKYCVSLYTPHSVCPCPLKYSCFHKTINDYEVSTISTYKGPKECIVLNDLLLVNDYVDFEYIHWALIPTKDMSLESFKSKIDMFYLHLQNVIKILILKTCYQTTNLCQILQLLNMGYI